MLASHWGWHMEHWGAWDWIAYGALFAGAAVLAAETGLSQSPSLLKKLPSIFRSPYWGFVPLILVLSSTGIFVTREVFAHEPAIPTMAGLTSTPSPDPSKVFLQSWGFFNPATYQVTVNASQIIQYKSDYHLLLLLRTGFSDIDRMTDATIEKSNLYTINDGLMVLAHPSSEKLRFLISGATIIEYNVVIIPYAISAEAVTNLDAVEKLGGKILASASQVLDNSKKAQAATKSKFCAMLSC